MSPLVQQLAEKLDQWEPEISRKVESLVAEIMDLADAGALDPALWLDEAERRERAWDAGEVEGIPAEQVIRELRSTDETGHQETRREGLLPAKVKRPLKELLLAMPPVGEDSDFERKVLGGEEDLSTSSRPAIP